MMIVTVFPAGGFTDVLGPGQVTDPENSAIVDATEDDTPLAVVLLLADFPLVAELLLELELQPAIPMASAARPTTHWR